MAKSWQEIERNLIDGALASVTVSSENPLYPRLNLYDFDRNTPFKFNTATAPHTITVDLGQSAIVNGVAIINHNASAAGWITAVLFEGSTNNFSTTAFSAAFTFTGGDTDDCACVFANNFLRYWRIRITASTAVPVIGELVFGRTFEYEDADDDGMGYSVIFDNASDMADSGAVIKEERGRAYREFRLKRSHVPYADTNDWATMERSYGINNPTGVSTVGISRGSLKPLIFIPKDTVGSGTTGVCYMVRTQDRQDFTEGLGQHFTHEITFTEER